MVALVGSAGGADAVSRILAGLRAGFPAAVIVSVGTRAIAAVLSGHGNDGATGATAAHRFGGVVIASDAATPEVFTMPYATISRDEVIDHVLGVDDIGPLLVALVCGPPPRRPDGDTALPSAAG